MNSEKSFLGQRPIPEKVVFYAAFGIAALLHLMVAGPLADWMKMWILPEFGGEKLVVELFEDLPAPQPKSRVEATFKLTPEELEEGSLEQEETQKEEEQEIAENSEEVSPPPQEKPETRPTPDDSSFPAKDPVPDEEEYVLVPEKKIPLSDEILKEEEPEYDPNSSTLARRSKSSPPRSTEEEGPEDDSIADSGDQKKPSVSEDGEHFEEKPLPDPGDEPSALVSNPGNTEFSLRRYKRKKDDVPSDPIPDEVKESMRGSEPEKTNENVIQYTMNTYVWTFERYAANWSVDLRRWWRAPSDYLAGEVPKGGSVWVRVRLSKTGRLIEYKVYESHVSAEMELKVIQALISSFDRPFLPKNFPKEDLIVNWRFIYPPLHSSVNLKKG